MNIEEIIKKYNYSNELSDLLRSLYPILVSYFGDENLIYSALSNTPIVLCSNVYDCLKENNLLDDSNNAIVGEKNLKQAAGVYCSKPNIKYNALEKTFTLESVDRIIAINAATLEYEPTKSTLVHEICHLIKSYHNEYTIKHDTIVERSGLISTTHQLSVEGDKVRRTLAFEHGVGFEEGLNAIAEDEVMSKLLGKESRSIGYGVIKAFATDVLRYGPEYPREIIKAQLYHDNSKLEQMMGEAYFNLVDFADELYKLNLEVMDFSLSDEDRKAKADEIRNFIEANYLPIKTSIITIDQKEKVM